VILFSSVYMVETMRWPNASSRVLSIVEGRMPKLDATSRLVVTLSIAGIFLVGRHVGDFRHAPELVQEDRRPVFELPESASYSVYWYCVLAMRAPIVMSCAGCR